MILHNPFFIITFSNGQKIGLPAEGIDINNKGEILYNLATHLASQPFLICNEGLFHTDQIVQINIEFQPAEKKALAKVIPMKPQGLLNFEPNQIPLI